MSKEHDQIDAGERPFSRAARFDGEESSGVTYRALQELILDSSADISAYRFQVSRLWHVAAVADEPPVVDLQHGVENVLAAGEQVVLPREVLSVLLQRHRQVLRQRLPWTETHYHPGRRIPLE